GSGMVVRLVKCVVGGTAQNDVEGKQLVGIEPVIKANAGFRAMAYERLFAQVISPTNFPVTVGKSAAGQADGQVGVWAQGITDSEFGVHVNRSDGQSQCQVGLNELRLVVIVIRVTGKRPAALQRLIVTKLKEP